jgi:superfamily II DNA or RNA helicase
MEFIGNRFGLIVFDECHHLSELCREYLTSYSIKHSILCSATDKDSLKYEFNHIFKDLTAYTKDLRDVIDEEILPDPKVYLLPLSLRMDTPTVSILKNPKAKGRTIECSYALRWNFIQQKTNPVRIYCTERQYLCDLNGQIEYWKKKYMSTRNPIMKNKWLKLCNDRLKWLSDLKTDVVYELLCHFVGFRTLTFCNSIEQTEVLGRYCINSKNKQSIKVLKDFNEGKIRHITACNMLNEGMNLVNCQIGVYANLNSSETIVKQRMGRLLRHPSPVLIIPYYKDTREEELVKEMMKDYNPKLIVEVNAITDIKI